MDTTIIVSILNIIGSLLGARGDNDMADYARLAADLVTEGLAAQGELAELVAELTLMVQEGRNPSAMDVRQVQAKRRELSLAIQRDRAPTLPAPE